jgi:hypothetical protein
VDTTLPGTWRQYWGGNNLVSDIIVSFNAATEEYEMDATNDLIAGTGRGVFTNVQYDGEIWTFSEYDPPERFFDLNRVDSRTFTGVANGVGIPQNRPQRWVKIDGDGTAPPPSPAREELLGTWRQYADDQVVGDFTIEINAATNKYAMVMPSANGVYRVIGNIEYDGTTWSFTYSNGQRVGIVSTGWTAESELTKEILGNGDIEFVGAINGVANRWVKIPATPLATPLAVATPAPEPVIEGGWQWHIDGTTVAELDITRNANQYAVAVYSLDAVERVINNVRYANGALMFDCSEDEREASSYILPWNASDDSFEGRVNEVDHLWERL